MEVLKDASASAIYGSRGANGVILITTRQAKQNVTRINVRQQTTLSEFSSELNLWRDPELMAMLSNESYINAGLTPLYTDGERKRYLLSFHRRITDNLDYQYALGRHCVPRCTGIEQHHRAVAK